jgi:hypothetical protein
MHVSMFLVAYIPAWFPGAQFKRVAAAYRARVNRFLNEPLERVKREMVARFGASRHVGFTEQFRKPEPLFRLWLGHFSQRWRAATSTRRGSKISSGQQLCRSWLDPIRYVFDECLTAHIRCETRRLSELSAHFSWQCLATPRSPKGHTKSLTASLVLHGYQSLKIDPTCHTWKQS